jgi:predicted MFS family arabinose efflux permease
MVAPLLVLLGSVLAIYCQGLFGAILQQEVAEDMRGRLSAILVTGRNIAIGAGALIGAAVITPLGSQQLLLVLSASIVVVIVASGGYRALKPL